MSTENHDEKRLEDNIYYRRLLQEVNKENPNMELIKFLDKKLDKEAKLQTYCKTLTLQIHTHK